MRLDPARFPPESDPGDLNTIRALLREYAAGLPVDLGFQGFEAELSGLPGRYAAPGGTLLLAWPDGAGAPLGCIGVRPAQHSGAAEIKRLYVREAARGTGLGRTLVLAALAFAQAAGYARAVLDTMPSMTAAQALYRSAGFTEADPPDGEAALGLRYFERALR